MKDDPFSRSARACSACTLSIQKHVNSLSYARLRVWTFALTHAFGWMTQRTIASLNLPYGILGDEKVVIGAIPVVAVVIIGTDLLPF